MARIVYNTLQNRKYLGLCTYSSLLTVTVVTYCKILPVHIAAPSKTSVYILNQTLSKINFSPSFRCISATVQRCSGATVQRCIRATVQRCNGATVQRCNGATVQRCNGATVQRCNGASVQRCNSATVQRRQKEGESRSLTVSGSIYM